jgi:hypothetical protein
VDCHFFTSESTVYMEKVAILTRKYGIQFGTCREGLSHLNTATSTVHG